MQRPHAAPCGPMRPHAAPRSLQAALRCNGMQHQAAACGCMQRSAANAAVRACPSPPPTHTQLSIVQAYSELGAPPGSGWDSPAHIGNVLDGLPHLAPGSSLLHLEE